MLFRISLKNKIVLLETSEGQRLKNSFIKVYFWHHLTGGIHQQAQCNCNIWSKTCLHIFLSFKAAIFYTPVISYAWLISSELVL